jgi:hypothetical protein
MPAMNVKLPRILSPNLGCPVIVLPQDLRKDGVDIVIAEPIEAPASDYRLVAKPSCKDDDCHEFVLHLGDRHELKDPGLRSHFLVFLAVAAEGRSAFRSSGGNAWNEPFS